VYRSDDASAPAEPAPAAPRPTRKRREPEAAPTSTPIRKLVQGNHEAGVVERSVHAVSVPFALALVVALQPLAWCRR
jgi:hypothetical protein